MPTRVHACMQEGERYEPWHGKPKATRAKNGLLSVCNKQVAIAKNNQQLKKERTSRSKEKH